MTALSVLRRIPAPAALGLAFAGAVTWLALSEPPDVPSTSPAQQQEAEPAALPPVPAKTMEQAPASSPAAPLPRQLRNVSPEGVRTPVVTAPLVRVEPARIYLERLNPPVEPLPDGLIELHGPQVVDAGTLKTKAFSVHLAHIKPLGIKETCVSRLGGQWPCGVRARTALRGLVRLNTISCMKVSDLGPKAMSAECSRGSLNLAAWMVENGWAVPDETAPDELTALLDAARNKKAGQWQSEWLAELPGTASRDQTEPDDLGAGQDTSEDRLRLGNELGLPGLSAGAIAPDAADLLNPLGLPAPETEDGAAGHLQPDPDR